MVNSAGIYLGDAFEIDWDFAPVLRTLEIAVRGLYRNFRGELLPPGTPVDVVFIEPLKRAAWLNRLSRFPVRDLVVLGNGIAHIASFETSDDEPASSVWTITFNYGVLFIAMTGSFAEAARRISARKRPTV